MSEEVRNRSKLEFFFKDLLGREIISNYANLKNFINLKNNEKNVYLGIDCTNKSLHFGHLFLLFQSLRFVKEDFKIFLVLGESTSLIGDPTDKNKERPLIDKEKVDFYSFSIKKQINNIFKNEYIFENDLSPLERFFSKDLLEKIYEILEINFDQSVENRWKKFFSYVYPFDNFNEDYFEIISNSNWLSKLNIVDFFREIGRNISLNYLLSKDWIKSRKDSGISYLSFNYPLLQAYDFYYLYKNFNCFGQLGGSDQWGNLTTGLKLIRSMITDNKSFAFNFSLLTDKDGNKISKSSSKSSKDLLFMDDSEKKWFDFFSNMTDEKAKIYLKQLTFISQENLEKIFILNNPSKLRIPQRILYELLSFLYFKTNFHNI